MVYQHLSEYQLEFHVFSTQDLSFFAIEKRFDFRSQSPPILGAKFHLNSKSNFHEKDNFIKIDPLERCRFFVLG